MAVTACSDLEEIVVNMQGEEEVELTIQTNIPSLGGSTRTAPTENITSITALAFDSDHELIKVVTEGVIQKTETDSTGTFKVKVPLRTRRIHFIAKNNGVFDEITDDYYGQTDVSLLVDRTSSAATDEDLLNNALHYWAMLDFDSAADLNDLTDELASAPNKDGKLTLIRNMAKLILDTPGTDDCIVGFMNYNTNGTLVPYIENGEEVEFCYQTVTNHDLPNRPIIIPVSEEKDLGKVHYMFEEYNDVGDLVYVICKIKVDTDTYKYFKFALKKDTSTYYYIVRNCKYRIKIDDVSKISASGHDTYDKAVKNVPINADTEEVNILFEPNPLSMFLDETGEVTVTIPKGITTFSVGYMKNYFIQGGVACKDDSYEPTQSEVTTGDGKGLWVDTYTVTGENDEEIVFTIELKEDVVNKGEAVSGIEIQFQGNGPGKTANKILTVNALLQGSLTVTPTTVEMVNRADTECTVTVKIESYDYNVGDYKLQVGDVDGVFAVTAPAGLDLHDDGYYYATKGQSYTFTFALKEAGTAGAEHKIDFDLFTNYHHLVGTTTVTLVEPTAYDTYELWFENSNTKVNGSTDYNYFFDWGETEGITISSSNNLESTSFYDDGANTHRAQAMVMGQDNSISFTIGATRYLTLLVANDGDDSDTPSIQLSNGSDWATATSEDAVVPAKYNFGNGEIGSAGRLIRYELPAGTYTLQGSDADYLLYYMRVSTTKPTMTDVAQPQLADYNLSWSGGAYANTEGKGYLKINDAKHIVDEDNLTHTVSLKDGNSLAISGGESTFDLTVATTRVTFSSTDSNEYGSSTNNQHLETNGSFALQTYNAGNYTLKGTIEKPNYKYSAFYDKLLLEAVAYEVKSPIMPGLYTSMDGDKLTPVNEFSSLDEAWAIGFKLPMVIPDLNVTPDNYSIGINIPDWTKSGDGDATGLGVIVGENGNYTLGNQDDMIHPREGWTYKIKWASIAGESITPMLTDEDDTDHHFTYKGTIAKQVTIPTPYTETALNITLDFYTENGVDFNNLTFGETKFYLKATIPSNIPAGKQILLNLATSEGRSGINEHQSRNAESSNGISYHYNDSEEVDGLVITTVENQTDYLMCWQYVRSNADNTNDVNITYTVSSDKHTLNGENQATITIKGNSQAVDNPLSIDLDFYADEDGDGNFENQGNSFNNLLLKLTDQTVASKVRLEATVTGDLSDYYGGNVVLTGEFPAYNAQYSGWAIHWVNSKKSGAINYYGNDQNGTGLQFTIDQNNTEQVYLIEWEFVPSTNNYSGGDIGFYYNISANANSPVKYNLSGDTQATIEFTNEPVIYCNFSGTNPVYGWGTKYQGEDVTIASVAVENEILKLTNSHGNVSNGVQALLSQAAVDVAFENGANYTLTFRVRAEVNVVGNNDGLAAEIPINFQDEDGDEWPNYGNFIINESENVQISTDWKTVTLTTTATGTPTTKGRIVFSFGHLVGTIYIDDLRLVRNNQ